MTHLGYMAHAANRPDQTESASAELTDTTVSVTRQGVLQALSRATGYIPRISEATVTEVLKRGRLAAGNLLASSAIHNVMVAQGAMDPEHNLSAFTHALHVQDQLINLKHQRMNQAQRTKVIARLKAEGEEYSAAAAGFAPLPSIVVRFQTDLQRDYTLSSGGPDRDALAALYNHTDALDSPVLDVLPTVSSVRRDDARDALVSADRVLRFMVQEAHQAT
jgi:hypothetical protein